MTQEPIRDLPSKTEQRLWNLLIAACLALGGWWLQNQYDTTLRLQQDLAQYMRFVDAQYVEKEMLKTLDAERQRQLIKIETKLDRIYEEMMSGKRGGGLRP